MRIGSYDTKNDRSSAFLFPRLFEKKKKGKKEKRRNDKPVFNGDKSTTRQRKPQLAIARVIEGRSQLNPRGKRSSSRNTATRCHANASLISLFSSDSFSDREAMMKRVLEQLIAEGDYPRLRSNRLNPCLLKIFNGTFLSNPFYHRTGISTSKLSAQLFFKKLKKCVYGVYIYIYIRRANGLSNKCKLAHIS